MRLPPLFDISLKMLNILAYVIKSPAPSPIVIHSPSISLIYIYSAYCYHVLINPFPHITNLQQTTLNTSYQKHEQSVYMKVHLLTKVLNIVAKGEIARYCQIICRNVPRATLNRFLQAMLICQKTWPPGGGAVWRFNLCLMAVERYWPSWASCCMNRALCDTIMDSYFDSLRFI